MLKPKIVFVVGHSNWGKSRTLKALTGESHRVRRTQIAGVEYFIRRMSNDDQPKSFIERMAAMEPDRWPQILAALCPDFDNPTKATATVLQGLRDRGYKLYFWVLTQQHGTGESIRSCEISRLRKYGKVELFSKQAEAAIRAKNFRAYVRSIGEF